MTAAQQDAQAIWRAADALLAQAAQMENEAERIRQEARRLISLAADVADGRIGRGV